MMTDYLQTDPLSFADPAAGSAKTSTTGDARMEPRTERPKFHPESHQIDLTPSQMLELAGGNQHTIAGH